MDHNEREQRVTELKLRRASMRATGLTPSMFDYPPNQGPCASEPAEGSKSRKASTALSSRASRASGAEAKEARDMRDVDEGNQNPWENYKKVERQQHEQQVRTNELERKLDRRNK